MTEDSNKENLIIPSALDELIGVGNFTVITNNIIKENLDGTTSSNIDTIKIGNQDLSIKLFKTITK